MIIEGRGVCVYLVQKDKGPLKGIVDLLVDRVSDHLPLHLLPSQSEVVVPQLVTGGQTRNETVNQTPFHYFIQTKSTFKGWSLLDLYTW